MSEEAIADDSVSFFNNHKCPNYKVIEKFDGYELREYPPGKWVETTKDSRFMKPAMNSMFMKLFGYISGDNENKEKIAMTVPVTTSIPNNNDDKWIPVEKTYKMRFFLPDSAPEPKGENVTIVQVPKKQFYVKEYRGLATLTSSSMSQYNELKKSIKNDNDNFFFVSYNSPFEMKNRRSEVWVEKTDTN